MKAGEKSSAFYLLHVYLKGKSAEIRIFIPYGMWLCAEKCDDK